MSRRRLSTGLGALLFALVLLGAAPGAARAQVAADEFEEVRTDSMWVRNLAGDSVWVDSVAFDSIRTVVVEDSLSKIPSVTIDNVPEGFHPTYKLVSSRIRQTTNIDQDLTFDYLLRDNLVMKTTNSWTKNRSERAGRDTDVKKVQLDLQYLLRKGLKVGLQYNRDDSTDDAQLQTIDIVRDRLVLNAVYIKKFWSAFQVTANAAGGIDNRNKDDEQRPTGAAPITKKEEKRGNSSSAMVGLKYEPSQTLSAEIQGNVERNGFAVTTSGSNQETVESKDNRDAANGVSAKLRWDEYEFAKVSLNLSADESERQFVRVAGGIETSKDKRRSASLNARGLLTERFDYDAKMNYSFGSRRFAIEQGQSSDRVDMSSEVALGYDLPSEIRSKLTLKRSYGEQKSFPTAGSPDNSVKTHQGSIVLNLSRALWQDTKLRTTGSIGMTRRLFADSTQDKDNLDRRFSLNLDYQPQGKIQGSALFSVDEVTTVNIDRSRSANNETRQTWRVSPTIDYLPRAGLRVQSAYTMTLIYIYKEFDSNRNTMTRVSELRSTCSWDMSRKSRLDLEYRFKLDESGSFRKEGSDRRFAREREGSTQKLTLRFAYQIFKNLSWETGQFVQVEKQYDLTEGKTLESHKTKAQIYNQLQFRRAFGESTILSFKAKQIQDASVPIFTRTGTLRGDERRIDWELTGSLTIKM